MTKHTDRILCTDCREQMTDTGLVPHYCGACDSIASRPLATVLVDGKRITGRVYSVRDNGWPCVETNSGRIASGPRV